jgi:hypothetical protein
MTFYHWAKLLERRCEWSCSYPPHGPGRSAIPFEAAWSMRREHPSTMELFLLGGFLDKTTRQPSRSLDFLLPAPKSLLIELSIVHSFRARALQGPHLSHSLPTRINNPKCNISTSCLWQLSLPRTLLNDEVFVPTASAWLPSLAPVLLVTASSVLLTVLHSLLPLSLLPL